MVIIPQTLHPCNATPRYILSISAMIPHRLSVVRFVVLLQTIFTTYKQGEWVAANTLTALKT